MNKLQKLIANEKQKQFVLNGIEHWIMVGILALATMSVAIELIIK